MNRVTIDLVALRDNLLVIDRWMTAHGASWTLVTKALCGHADTLRALRVLGVRTIADSRLDNLDVVARLAPDVERWYLRLPPLSAVDDVVRLAHVSLNSESQVIRALSDEAVRQDRRHGVVIMVELGDLREGILPGTLLDFYRRVFELPNIDVVGIGAQLGCLAGAVPNVDQLTQLLLYRELLELKFGRALPLVSAGSSVSLALLQTGEIPAGINHFRIGEAVFLGTDLIHGGLLPGLRDDVVLLDAEIAEITRKSLVPVGELGATTPFAGAAEDDGHDYEPGERGYRALVTVGELDTHVPGLIPVSPDHRVAGGSSDITVVNLGSNKQGLKVGDTIRFRLDYAAFVRIMGCPYVDKAVAPDVEELSERFGANPALDVPPTLTAVGSM